MGTEARSDRLTEAERLEIGKNGVGNDTVSLWGHSPVRTAQRMVAAETLTLLPARSNIDYRSPAFTDLGSQNGM